MEGGEAGGGLTGIPKFTFGRFENTVSNYGVLLNRNFIGTSTLHQMQKYGKIAKNMDRLMQEEKDQSRPDSKNDASHRQSITDARTSIKAVHELNGHRLLLTLSSFSIVATDSDKTYETLQVPFLRLMAGHVPTGHLVRAVEGAMKQEGGTVVVDYLRMESRMSGGENREVKYEEGPHCFERGPHQLTITLPRLEIFHAESDFKRSLLIDNSDILDIVDSDFENAEGIVGKYLDPQEL